MVSISHLPHTDDNIPQEHCHKKRGSPQQINFEFWQAQSVICYIQMRMLLETIIGKKDSHKCVLFKSASLVRHLLHTDSDAV